ncbi:MAG: tetratricopeptide repeat protein [Candidatus Omnitrophica bacterium]|nr:tetratricopeptide repeat protein [Candidatus Omnitrophota bacterium]MDD5430047.1 tetratricopeptide repeat protein [Candidatus Omnitrophota bacterium]
MIKFVKCLLFLPAVLTFTSLLFLPAKGQDFYSEVSSQETLGSQILYKQYIDNGTYYFHESLYKEAKELFWKAINLSPENPDAYINLAIVHIKEGNIETAQRLLQKAKTLHLDGYYQEEILLYNLGVCFFEKKDYAEAEKYFSQSLALHQDFGEAKYYLALCLEKRGDHQKAFVYMFSARNSFRSQENVSYRKMAEDALERLKEIYKVNNISLARSFLRKGKKAARQGDWDQAFILLKESEMLNPKDSRVYYEIALLYIQKQSYHNAVEYFNKVIEANPSSSQAYQQIGRAYREIKYYPQAQEAFSKACEFSPDDASICYEQGVTYLEEGKVNSARKYLNKAKRMALKEKDFSLVKKIDFALKRGSKIKYKKPKPPYMPKRDEAVRPIRKFYPRQSSLNNRGSLSQGYYITDVDLETQPSK